MKDAAVEAVVVEVARLSLEPDDLLIVNAPEWVNDPSVIAEFQYLLRARLDGAGHPNHVVVLPHDTKVSVLSLLDSDAFKDAVQKIVNDALANAVTFAEI